MAKENAGKLKLTADISNQPYTLPPPPPLMCQFYVRVCLKCIHYTELIFNFNTWLEGNSTVGHLSGRGGGDCTVDPASHILCICLDANKRFFIWGRVFSRYASRSITCSCVGYCRVVVVAMCWFLDGHVREPLNRFGSGRRRQVIIRRLLLHQHLQQKEE